ncbi:MAG: hypothetical protein RR061_08910 [Muribaculaceae bacterium]
MEEFFPQITQIFAWAWVERERLRRSCFALSFEFWVWVEWNVFDVLGWVLGCYPTIAFALLTALWG